MPTIVSRLLQAPLNRFDGTLHSRIPDQHGIYAIYRIDTNDHEVIRAGRTKFGADGLLQRIYRNQYVGQQEGNLRAQLVESGFCPDKGLAKTWMQRNAAIRFLVVEDDATRTWAEYFMLSVLRPRFCG